MAMAAYHVLSDQITTDTKLSPAGNSIIDLHVIPYEIDSGPAAGTTRIVRVTDNNYNAKDVAAAIEADLNATHQIASLGQPAPGLK